MDVLNEDEIKIEYYGELLSDPLADATENILIVTDVTEPELIISCADACHDDDSLEISPERNIATWYKEVDENGQYLCKFCSLKYSRIQTLRYHIKRKHFTEAQVLKSKILNNKRRKRIKCHICYKTFTILDDLKSHFNTFHSTTLNKSCSFCNAMFSNVHEKYEHERNVHKVFKKFAYICTICGYQTPKKSCYIDHESTHSLNKQIKCKYCDYCTNKLINLRTHERIHTNSKPYKCDFQNCNYTCSAKSGLNSHKLKHFPDENMLYCDKCNYKTVYTQSLKKHQDIHKQGNIIQ